VGDLEEALLARHGPRVGALLVAEELGLQELAGEAGAVHVDEGLVGAGPVPVEPAGEDALAGARLALDQDGAAGGEELPGLLGHLAMAADVPRTGRPPRGLAGPAGDLAALLALGLEEAPHHHEERGQLDGLGQELVRAFLDRAHGEVDRGVAGQDDHRQRGSISRMRGSRSRAVRRAACGRG